MIPKAELQEVLKDYESYSVHTEDGYILTLFRLIPPTSIRTADEKLLESFCGGGQPKSKPPVLLVHGFSCSGLIWTLNYPGKDLPHMLVERGYDCWVANLRSCEFSREHTTLDNDSSEYWNFGLEELGLYDIPAMIDRILEITGCPSLYYVGTSLGATLLFVTMSAKPEYNEKVKTYFSLGPVVHTNHTQGLAYSTILPVSYFLSKFKYWYQTEMGSPSVLDLSRMAAAVMSPFTNLNSDKIAFFLIRKLGEASGTFGERGHIDQERASAIARHLYSTTSTKVAAHCSQIIFRKKFGSFDYGESDNQRVYGSRSPPNYKISNLSCPTVLFSGQMDKLSTVRDVEQLSHELPNLVESIVVTNPAFSHINFFVGKDTDSLVYKRILQFISYAEETGIV